MTTAHPRVVRVNQDSKLVVDGGNPMDEFVVLEDEHGGIHLMPRHLYAEIQNATYELAAAVKDRRSHLSKVLADMPDRETEGNLSELTSEVRRFSWLRQSLGRLLP